MQIWTVRSSAPQTRTLLSAPLAGEEAFRCLLMPRFPSSWKNSSFWMSRDGCSGMLAVGVFGPGSSRWPCRGSGLLLTQLRSERPQVKVLGIRGPGVPSACSLMLSRILHLTKIVNKPIVQPPAQKSKP